MPERRVDEDFAQRGRELFRRAVLLDEFRHDILAEDQIQKDSTDALQIAESLIPGATVTGFLRVAIARLTAPSTMVSTPIEPSPHFPSRTTPSGAPSARPP